MRFWRPCCDKMDETVGKFFSDSEEIPVMLFAANAMPLSYRAPGEKMFVPIDDCPWCGTAVSEGRPPRKNNIVKRNNLSHIEELYQELLVLINEQKAVDDLYEDDKNFYTEN